MRNIFYEPNEGIEIKSFTNQLRSYTQTNCKVTLTDNGYRIYRTPNLSSANSNKTFGGFKICNQNTDSVRIQNAGDNFFNLIEGHTYIIRWHVSGQSQNAFTYIQWDNNFGYSGAGVGLMPTPINVIKGNIANNFTGEQECFYQFTISDSLFKTCTNGKSAGYTTGEIYLSYRHLDIGFNYTNTGELGTDLYITNLRMYDITDSPNGIASVKSNGIILPSQVIENSSTASFQEGGDVICNNFYEY